MRSRNKRYRLAYLTALVAALFLALGPALAPVLAASPKTRTIEICTAFGIVEMALAGDYDAAGEMPASDDHGDSTGHCAFCNLRNFSLASPLSLGPASLAGFHAILPVTNLILASVRVSGSAGPRGPPRLL